MAAAREACDPYEEEGKEDSRHAILMGRCLCRYAWITAFLYTEIDSLSLSLSLSLTVQYGRNFVYCTYLHSDTHCVLMVVGSEIATTIN